MILANQLENNVFYLKSSYWNYIFSKNHAVLFEMVEVSILFYLCLHFEHIQTEIFVKMQ